MNNLMERQKRVINAIETAISKIETAIELVVHKEGNVEQPIWQAASEVEYALFLMALTQKSESSAWKTEHKTREIDVGQALTAAQDSLEEAKKMVNNNSDGAYQKAWVARRHILAAQDLLRAQKKKEA